VERHIASQRAAGRGYGDITRRGSSWDYCFDESIGDNSEICLNSVDCNASRSGEALAKNRSGLADFASGAHEGHERAEAHVEGVDGTAAIEKSADEIVMFSSVLARPVEQTACGL
jgi:hypothetical protein